MKLYVGNLSYSTTEDTIYAEFTAFGEVEEVFIPTDRDTGRPRGFAFVTMKSADDGQSALSELNGKEIDGRTIVVNEARPKRQGGGGGGPRGGGGGGGGGGGPRRGGSDRW